MFGPSVCLLVTCADSRASTAGGGGGGGGVPCFSGCLQLGNELQKQSRDQTQAIKPADWSVWSRDPSASCKQPEKHGN